MPGPAEEELGIIRQFPSEAPKGVQTKIFLSAMRTHPVKSVFAAAGGREPHEP